MEQDLRFLGSNDVKYSRNIRALSRPRDLMCSNLKMTGRGLVLFSYSQKPKNCGFGWSFNGL